MAGVCGAGERCALGRGAAQGGHPRAAALGRDRPGLTGRTQPGPTERLPAADSHPDVELIGPPPRDGQAEYRWIQGLTSYVVGEEAAWPALTATIRCGDGG